MIHSESIHSRLLVGNFFFEISLLSRKPRRAGYVMWEFTGDNMGGVGFFLCRKDPGGNTAPLQIF